jgi:DNA-binding SARP family transcriptional activator
MGLCARAAELHRGDFLPEEPYEPWVEIRRLALKDEYINALFQLVDIHLDLKNLEEAVRWCVKIVEAEPVLERACRTLMRIYALQGRRAEALKVFENFKKRLMEDIGVEPDISTVRLYDRIRSGGD